MSIGVPIKVLHEAEGHVVTCETNTGEVYRGKLIEAEDNMNCQMTQVTVTYRDGRVAQLENVYIRGSKIRFLILPDMLKNAPMFKRQGNKPTAGRGKSAILRAQGGLCWKFQFMSLVCLHTHIFDVVFLSLIYIIQYIIHNSSLIVPICLHLAMKTENETKADETPPLHLLTQYF